MKRFRRLTNRHVPLIFTFVLLVAAILVVRQMPQQSTDTRTRAAKSTKLYFTPATTASSPLQKQTGQTFSLDLMIDPGTNVPSYVKFQIQYDASKLSVSGANALVVNAAAFPQTIEGPVVSSGQIAAGVGIGSDPTKGITAVTKVATITFTATQNSGAPVEIKYGPITQVLSIGSGDIATDNVLASAESAYVVIGQMTSTLAPSATGTNPTPTTGTNPTPTGTNPLPTDVNPTATTMPSPTSGPLPTPTPVACSANEVNFYAAMSGDREVPPNSSSANAITTFAKQPTPDYYIVTIKWNGLPTKGVRAIHIHGPARPGVSAPPRVTLYENPLTQDFPNPFIKNEVYIPQDVFQDIITGKAYVNIHTFDYPDGEIRGQILCGNPPPITVPTATPMPTPIGPTPTLMPQGFRLNLELLMHGIGAAGDNANPKNNSLSNKNPIHQEIPLNVQVVNSDNELVATKIVPAFYNSDAGYYFGHVDIMETLPEKEYVVKIKTDRYLRKLMPGFFKITPGKETKLPRSEFVAGDINNDNQLNILDYNILYDCGYGAITPYPMVDRRSIFNKKACQSHVDKKNADINDDGRISASDYNLFIRELSVQVGE